jgi:hypothetical protein
MAYIDDKPRKKIIVFGWNCEFLRQFFSSPNEVFRAGGHDLCLYFACTGGNAYKELQYRDIFHGLGGRDVVGLTRVKNGLYPV